MRSVAGFPLSTASLSSRVVGIEWWRAVRYSAVSVIGVAVTQTLLLLAHGVVGLAPVVSNVTAVSLAALPVFVLNRAWVWGLRGPSSLRREVLPFWGFTLAGLALSTAAVAGISAVTDATVAVSIANIGAFGVLWVAKFFVLDEMIFAPGTDELVVGTP